MEFEITSGRMRVTDPCYEVSVHCAGEVKAKNGIWIASYEVGQDRRVESLTVRHINHARANIWEHSDIDVGVDSGQAGFFDAARYAQEQGGEYDDLNTFYGKVCALTYDEKNPNQRGGVLEFGVASSSGFGDGSYKLTTASVDGEVVAARITFIEEEEEHQEEEEEDEED